MSELVPVYRIEEFIQAIIDGSATPKPAVEDVELYLAKIAGDDVELPVPTSRVDFYLAKIAGEDVELPQPVERIDFWLAQIAGMDVETPEPVYRIEFFLDEWAQGGAQIELKTATGYTPLSLPGAVHKAIHSLTRYGVAEQATTPTPSEPAYIACNNGAIKMLNLANMAEDNLDIGYYINNSGARTSAPLNFYTLGYIPVLPNTKYTMKTSISLNYFNTMEYDSSQGFIKRTLYGSAGVPAGDTTTFTTGETTYYLRFGSNINGSPLAYSDVSAITWMLTQSETAMDYIPYGQLTVVGTPEVLSVNTQTASVADLFGTEMEMDEHELISGTVIRKFGFKAFDGTEGWSASSSVSGVYLYYPSDMKPCNPPIEGVSTHFKGTSASTSSMPNLTIKNTYGSGGAAVMCVRFNEKTSVADFKAWLAEQYANGTPVIAMYPLVSAQTESVTPQALHTTQGDNTVTVTAPDIAQSNSMMQVEYYGKV